MRPQRGGDHRSVGLGAAHEKLHEERIVPAERADDAAGIFAVFVLAVAAGLEQVGFGKAFQYARMRALAVIAFKADQRDCPS